jgi:hypothetical protein
MYTLEERNMTQFKIGDKVKSVVQGGDYLELDKEYVVTAIYSRNSVNVDDIPLPFPERWFEPFVETPREDYKAMKFRVNSPEQSKEIQEALFSMGYGWEYFGKQIKFTDDVWAWLHTDEDGFLYRGIDIDKHHPELVGCEYTIKIAKSYELIPVENVKEVPTIELNGEMYTQEEVASAVQFLKFVRKNKALNNLEII